MPTSERQIDIPSSLPILPDSVSRTIESPEFQEKCQQIRANVAAKYEREIESASFVEWVWMKWRIHREVDRELRLISPSDRAL
ncbi:hypothetical protein SH449x_005129 [Pirellulaceae bacterium SH449]